jgi:glycosyltransferase involved in cell wall biosynthesis
MRVLFCTNSRDRGSTSRTLEAWTRLLPTHGVLPVVSVGGDGPLLDAFQRHGTQVYRHPIRVYFDSKRPVPFLKEIGRLVWRMRRSRIQLVHLNEHDHYPVVARAAYLARIPAVVHLRFLPEPDMCRWLFRAPYTPERLFFTSRTQMSDASAAVAAVVPSERWRLIYNGLDFDVFGQDRSARDRLRSQWGLGRETIAIGTASSISSRKRLDQFIRLIAELDRLGLDVRGFIAGQPYFPEDERELAALRQLTETLGLQRRVTFLGYVEPAEPLFHAWDVCVSTSAYETFGMTILEAMACRCPVVCYPGGSIAEVVGDAAPVVADNDFQALVSEVRKLASNKTYREEKGADAWKRAKQFDVSRSVQQLAAEYHSLVPARPVQNQPAQ